MSTIPVYRVIGVGGNEVRAVVEDRYELLGKLRRKSAFSFQRFLPPLRFGESSSSRRGGSAAPVDAFLKRSVDSMFPTMNGRGLGEERGRDCSRLLAQGREISSNPSSQ